MACLDIEFAFNDFSRAEGTDLRLVAIDRGEEVKTCLVLIEANHANIGIICNIHDKCI